MPGDARIDVEGLWVDYRPKTRRGWRRRGGHFFALRDLTLRVGAGRAVGVIGRNGSGKSTLLHCVSGVFRPTRGRVTTDGRVAALIDLSAGFHRELTGRENLLVSGVLSGLSRAEVRSRYGQIVEFSGLDRDALDAPLRTYSAGMGLRLAFSLAICSEPDVLAVDEVLAVGDASFQRRCLDSVARVRERGGSLLVVSHDLELIATHCDHVVVLERGEAHTSGRPDRAVAAYLELCDGRPEVPDTSPSPLFRATRNRRRGR